MLWHTEPVSNKQSAATHCSVRLLSVQDNEAKVNITGRCYSLYVRFVWETFQKVGALVRGNYHLFAFPATR